LVAQLPADLPAAVFVVVHIDPSRDSHLADLLNASGPLPVREARDGDRILPGQILVAPRDRHLVIRNGHVEVAHGARENGHRPAVNLLFRTASAAYGPRVIGVVLTGNLDCGTAGLLSIKARAGLSVVQDPAEAVAPSMPASAIAHAKIDHVVSLADLSALLVRLVRSKAPAWPSEVRRPVKQMEGVELGQPDVELGCPSCHGKLTVSDVDDYLTFRCHVGHAFSLQSLTAAQAEEVEAALWGAVRALEEGSTLSGRIAGAMTGTMRERLLEKEHTQREQADVVRSLILGGRSLAPADGRAPTATTARSAKRGIDKKRGSAQAPRQRALGDGRSARRNTS
jgi:two-component system chemotaxis response regulator CheB